MALPPVTPAGKLNNRVLIQRPVDDAREANGEPIVAWVDVGTVWASVTPLTGREIWNGQQVQSDVEYAVTTRHSSQLDGYASSWRLIFGSRILEVDSVSLRNETPGTMLDWMCRNQANDPAGTA